MIRALKGCPLSVIFSLLIAGRPLTKKELCRYTDYSDKVVSTAIDLLELDYQLVAKSGGVHRYALTANAHQLSFANYQLAEPTPQIETQLALSTSTIPTITESEKVGKIPISDQKVGIFPTFPTTTTRTTTNPTSESSIAITTTNSEKSESPTFEIQQDVVNALIQVGIAKTRAEKIAQLAHIDVVYVTAHIEKFELECQLDDTHTCGLLISRLERQWNAPTGQELDRLQQRIHDVQRGTDRNRYLEYIEEKPEEDAID